MPAPLRAALIGYGLGGAAFHAPFLDAVPGLSLAMIVTSNEERAAAARARYRAARVLASVDDVWRAAEGLDLVVITTSNDAHVPLALAAVEHGLPVVIDKPLAPSSTDAARVVRAARDAGAVATVFQNRRWDGDFLTVSDLVAAGELGQVNRFESRFERWRPQPKGGWRESGAPGLAGGLLFDLGSHLVDQAVQLLGWPTHVYAEVVVRRPSAEVDDDTFVALTHANGARSHLWMSAVAPRIGARFRVLGSVAGFESWGLDPQEAALRAGDRPYTAGWGEVAERASLFAGDQRTPVRLRAGAYESFYEGVVAALRGERPAPVDPVDAVLTTAVLEAAMRSSREQVVVPFDAAATRERLGV